VKSTSYLENRCELVSILDSSCQLEIPLSNLADTVIRIPKDSNFSMVRLSEYPQVLALEYPHSWFMKSALGRIATYVEVLGKTRIPTLKESPNAAGYDLKLADVADFFNVCANEHIALSQEEKDLKGRLIVQGLLTPIENGLLTYLQPTYQASSAHVLIAVDPWLNPFDRKVSYIHEYSHALYFLDEEFRSRISRTFTSLAPEMKRFLHGLMIASGYYESGESWLIETETQAHAVEPQGGGHGFGNLIAAAEKNCDVHSNRSSDLACKDFHSYPDELREGLITYLRDHYVKASQDKIPFLTSLEKLENEQKELEEHRKILKEILNKVGSSPRSHGLIP